MNLDEQTRRRLDAIVGSEPVVLFMKGDRRMPQCGFSATVVQILDSLLADYTTVDVLADPAIREGIKVYSSWPTIPPTSCGRCTPRASCERPSSTPSAPPAAPLPGPSAAAPPGGGRG
jgi:glutaredoxin-related protein